MAKFTVRVQQYVEEMAYLEIEADTAADAYKAAREMLENGDVDDWQDGDDTMSQCVTEVVDADGNEVVLPQTSETQKNIASQPGSKSWPAS